MSIPGGRIAAVFAMKQFKKRVLDPAFPERTYFDWERGLFSAETSALQEKLTGFIPGILGKIADGLEKLVLRDNISDAVYLEKVLGLPDTENLVSRRLPKLKLLQARLDRDGNSDLQNLESKDSPFYGFFTEDELRTLRSKFREPLNKQSYTDLYQECHSLLVSRGRALRK